MVVTIGGGSLGAAAILLGDSLSEGKALPLSGLRAPAQSNSEATTAAPRAIALPQSNSARAPAAEVPSRQALPDLTLRGEAPGSARNLLGKSARVR